MEGRQIMGMSVHDTVATIMQRTREDDMDRLTQKLKNAVTALAHAEDCINLGVTENANDHLKMALNMLALDMVDHNKYKRACWIIQDGHRA